MHESTGLGRIVNFIRRATRLLLTIGAVWIAVGTRAASAQPPSITSCTKITKPGFYQVDSDLFAEATPGGDCLVITAPNVVLNLNTHTISGNTDADGIHVKPTASGVFIEGEGATIEKFGEGIEIDAANALVDNFTVTANSDAGVLLNRAQRADISFFSATSNLNDGVRIARGAQNLLQSGTILDNGRYGVWIDGSSHNSVGNFDVESNGMGGIYIGCSLAGPGLPCIGKVPESNFNYVFSGIASVSNSVPQQYGIAIDLHDNYNPVVNVEASGNKPWDLFDVNPDCAGNSWFAEITLLNVQPSVCIK
ncbi:MAG: right-handed parallel beta-helix repeat-containing protein [Candidatus Binataceae bacterium]|nr:right-handed parallel beta-helix repeat-containing protein [Candidatus Binataceae bacterium]